MSFSSQFRKIGTYSAFLVSTVCLASCQPTTGPSSTSPHIQSHTSAKAKNVILFIGDGMGVSTVTAGRIFVGQEMGKSGEEHVLSFENFDHLALIKTYNTNAQVPDSAGTATAIMSGYKTNIGTINVEPGAEFQGCGDIVGKPTLAKIADNAGKSVGVIATARITHATPAAVYGYADSRDWEANKDIPIKAAEFGCRSLTSQLVDPETPVNLALGGGAKEFTAGQLEAWDNQGDNHIVITTGSEFAALSATDQQDVLGLFNPSHMAFEADRQKMGDEPSLADLTGFAIENLSARDDNGYVLMVEAGRIDHAHHGGNAYRALKDFQAFDQAIQTAIDKTGDDTLILVTADHSHVFTIAGYPRRGNPILGLVSPADYIAEKMEDDKRYIPAKDGNPYTTLGYHNGGGDVRDPDGPPLTDNMVQDPNYRQQVAVPMQSETHAGEDVPLYAHGPGAENVKGVMEQNEIHGVMMKAMGLD